MESVQPSYVPKINRLDMAITGVIADRDANGLCPVIDLGQAEYGAVYELQKKIHARRVNGDVSDALLLVEHPPTFTIGRSGSP